MSMKNPLTPAGIEPATFRFVAQHLNHCATLVPLYVKDIILIEIVFSDCMDLLNNFSTEVSIKNDLKVLFS